MQKRTIVTSVFAIGLLAAGGAFAQNYDQPGHQGPVPGSSNNSVSATKDAAGHAVGEVSAEMTSSLKGFATAAAMSDMYEVEAGKIAQERTTNADVKMFAGKMIKAHMQTTADLKPLVVAADSTIVPPTTLDDRHQRMIDELRGAKAADFDKRYISQQVDAHKEALILMRGYAKDGDVSAVKGFAAKTEPVVQAHLDMAEHLMGEVAS